MNNLLLEGWTPIILTGLFFAIMVFVLSKLINKKVAYIVASFLLLISIILFAISIFLVGGWDGMAYGFYIAYVFIGSCIGMILVALSSSKNIEQ